MKQKILILLTVVLLLGLIGGFFIAKLSTNPENVTPLQEKTGTGSNGTEIDKKNCVSDDCLQVDELRYPAGVLPKDVIDSLNLAISDEYKAQTTYALILEKFGSIRPFSMIVRAEEQHISSLKALYDKYGVEIPKNAWEDNILVPDTIQESCSLGVKSEIENVNLYKEKLLPVVTEYADITSVFTNLMNASQNKHLPAFEKCS